MKCIHKVQLVHGLGVIKGDKASAPPHTNYAGIGLTYCLAFRANADIRYRTVRSKSFFTALHAAAVVFLAASDLQQQEHPFPCFLVCITAFRQPRADCDSDAQTFRQLLPFPHAEARCMFPSIKHNKNTSIERFSSHSRSYRQFQNKEPDKQPKYVRYNVVAGIAEKGTFRHVSVREL